MSGVWMTSQVIERVKKSNDTMSGEVPGAEQPAR